MLRPAIWVLALVFVAATSAAVADFVPFESGLVRPLALSPDGTRLFAVNTPDNRLEIFRVSDAGLLHLAAVPVGLEPVAVAARTSTEVWVVNQLSDSVSIVDTSIYPPRVTRTLLVSDEPYDVVFAGPGGNRAFITTARRGQNDTDDPLLTTGGVGRARVWVFDATSLGASAGGNPITKIDLFGDTPRPLAVSGDGSTVYAGVFHSGNQTTAVFDLIAEAFAAVDPNFDPVADPNTNYDGAVAPFVGQIVAWDDPNSQWVDDRGRVWGSKLTGPSWTRAVNFTLPDLDVFAIDADANPPVETSSYPHVGTILFNMIVNPSNGRLYVANGDAKNLTRFEGPGTYLSGLGGFPSPFTVRGNLHQYGITVIDPNTASVDPVHLNKHINYLLDPNALESAGVKNHSLATPLDMAISSDGSTLYVPAFGSSKVGVFSTAALEANTFTPNDANHIDISGGGPAGVVLDEAQQRLYVLARFDQTISVVDLSSSPGTETAVVSLPHNPEPASVTDGRPILYDALLTSSNGEATCSSCHVFGRMDDISWDLGNPDGDVLPNNNVQGPLGSLASLLFLIENFGGGLPDGFVADHHPMKGPMLTQSLRGLDNHGPMHWRGDRSGGAFADDPNSLDEVKAFNAFIVAFEGLIGRETQLDPNDMQKFTDFILQVPYQPNPIRNLDNSLDGDPNAVGSTLPARGRALYLNEPTDAPSASGLGECPPAGCTCNQCHVLDVGEAGGGFFGTDGTSSFDGVTQIFKIPHLRNVYQRVGMFGLPGDPNGFTGDQIRGYGYLHDGSIDTLFSFASAAAFTFPSGEEVSGPRSVEAFMHAFDTNFAPIMAQQVTLDDPNSAPDLLLHGDPNTTVGDRIDLLVARALVTSPVPECDLVVKGNVGGETRGWHMTAVDNFVPDKTGGSALTEAQIRALAATAGVELTFTCVPPGSGNRIGIDRDEDGTVDGSECGDSNGDGVAVANDPDVLRLGLAGLTEIAGARCSVIGGADLGDDDSDGIPNECTIRDWVVSARDVLALSPGLSQVCSAAL